MNVPRSMAIRMAGQAAWNMWRKRPLTVSFEVTHACTANCWHCNWGGPIKETRRSPEEYAAIYRELKAPVVNISGGEPLARGDLDDIVRAIGTPGGLPWIVVVTNGSNLSAERFLRLKRAGMHQLSVSIDFPDDRHSGFRRIPGLFEHLNSVIPELVKIGDPNDVNLNCCITAWNYQALPDIVRLAQRWGVWLNFSSYSLLRMDDPNGLVKNNGKTEGLTRAIQEVIDLKQQGYPVYTMPSTMWKFHKFLVEGHAGGCQAGYRFVVINPDGRLTPCAMVMAYFNDVRDMQREFSCKNTCGACYISTRANAEKTAGELLTDNLQILSRYVPLRRKTRAASA
ncbi:MAG TPA: radical SAM protein [Gemmatimonadales bacterium]